MMFVVTPKQVRFMDNGKVRRVKRSTLPAGNPLKTAPVGTMSTKGVAAELEALKIEGGHK